MTYVLPRITGNNATGTDRYGVAITDNWEAWAATDTDITFNASTAEWEVAGATAWTGQISGSDSNERVLYARDRTIRFVSGSTNSSIQMNRTANNVHMQFDNCNFIFDSHNEGGSTSNNSSNRTTIGWRDDTNARNREALPSAGRSNQLTASFLNCKFICNESEATFSGGADGTLFIMGDDFTNSTLITNSAQTPRILFGVHRGCNIDGFTIDGSVSELASPDIDSSFSARDLTGQIHDIDSGVGLAFTNFYPYNQRFGDGIVFRELSQLGPNAPLLQMGEVNGGNNEVTLIEANRTIRNNGNVWNNSENGDQDNWRVNEGINYNPFVQVDASANPTLRTEDVRLVITPGYTFSTAGNRRTISTDASPDERIFNINSSGNFTGNFDVFDGSSTQNANKDFDIIIGTAQNPQGTFADTTITYTGYSTDVDYRSFQGLAFDKFQVDSGTTYIADDESPVTNGGLVETIIDADDSNLNFDSLSDLNNSLVITNLSVNCQTLYALAKKHWSFADYDATQAFPPQNNITDGIFDALHSADNRINYQFNRLSLGTSVYVSATNTLDMAVGVDGDGIYTLGQDADSPLGIRMGTLSTGNTGTIRINRCDSQFTSNEMHTFDAVQADPATNYTVKDSVLTDVVMNFAPTSDQIAHIHNCSGNVTINNTDDDNTLTVSLTGAASPTVTTSGDVVLLVAIEVDLTGPVDGNVGRTTVYASDGTIIRTETANQNGFSINSLDSALIAEDAVITVVWSGPDFQDISIVQTLVNGTNDFSIAATPLAHPSVGDSAYNVDNFSDTSTAYSSGDNDITISFQAAADTPAMGDATTNFFLNTSGLIRGSDAYNLFLFNNPSNLNIVSSIGVSSGAQINGDFVNITPKNNESYNVGYIENTSTTDPQTIISVTKDVTAVVDGETESLSFKVNIPSDPADFDLGATVSAVGVRIEDAKDEIIENQVSGFGLSEDVSLGIPVTVDLPNT